MFTYEKLEVWQLSKNVAIKIYEITKKFPSEERYGLVSQMNRAAVSVASNIAEGSSRSSFKEQAYFSEIAYGSLMEVTCQLQIAEELGLVTNEVSNSIYREIELLARKLSSFKKSQLNRYKK